MLDAGHFYQSNLEIGVPQCAAWTPKAKATVGVRWHQGQDRHMLATCALTSSMPLQQRLHRNDPGPCQAPAMSTPTGGVYLNLSGIAGKIMSDWGDKRERRTLH